MLVLHKRFRAIATCLAVVMLVQACTVYKKGPFSLAEAAESDAKVEIVTTNRDKLELYRIVLGDDGNYYGAVKKRGKVVIDSSKVLQPMEISEIRVVDKRKTTLESIMVPVVFFGLLAVGIASSPPISIY